MSDFSEIVRAQLTEVTEVNDTGPRLVLRRASEFEARPVRWMWPSFLPRGKFVLLAGQAGISKTTLALKMAATLSRGDTWPDASEAPIGSTVFWSGEDEIEDTLKPRLVAAGADADRVFFIGGVDEDGEQRLFDPAADLPLLIQAIDAMPEPPALVVVDPVMNAVPGNSDKANEVRRDLAPLKALAERYDLCVMGITHFHKAKGDQLVQRVLGSQAFTALARVVLVAAATPPGDDRGDGVLLVAKTNIGRKAGFFFSRRAAEVADDIEAYEIEFGPALDISDAESIAMRDGKDDADLGALEEAIEFLAEELKAGPVAATDLIKAAAEQDISSATLRRAKQKLGVMSRKSNFGAGWRWCLPDEEGETPDPVNPAY